MKVVHILKTGHPLCGFIAPLRPSDWPEGHTWVNFSEVESATCARCRAKAGLPTTTAHWLEKIENVYVVVADDVAGEGVCGAKLGNQWIPLIAADETRLENIKYLARSLAREKQQTLRLVKFSTREVVEEIKPE